MNNFKLDVLAIKYDNNLFISYDVVVDSDCVIYFISNRALIPCSDLKIFHSNLTIRIKSLLNISESPEGCQLQDCFSNNEFNSGGTIDDDCVNCSMGVDR